VTGEALLLREQNGGSVCDKKKKENEEKGWEKELPVQ
jgi:hypothetical protein